MTRAPRLPTFTLAKEDLDEGCIVYHFIIDAAARTCALVTRQDTREEKESQTHLGKNE